MQAIIDIVKWDTAKICHENKWYRYAKLQCFRHRDLILRARRWLVALCLVLTVTMMASVEIGIQYLVCCICLEMSRHIAGDVSWLSASPKISKRQKGVAIAAYVRRCRDMGTVPDIVSLFGRDLSGLHLQHMDLSQVHLKDANLDGSVLEDIILDGADLSHISARYSTWKNVSLKHATIAEFKGCSSVWQQCDMTKSLWQKADMQHAQVIGGVCTGAFFAHVNFSQSHFSGADLAQVQVQQSVCNWVVFEESALETTLFTNTNLLGTFNAPTSQKRYFDGFQKWQMACAQFHPSLQ